MSRSAYRRYSQDVQREVARSRNPNRFPELEIPRSTAYHWIKNFREREQGSKDIAMQRAMFAHVREFLSLLLCCLPDDLDLTRLTAADRKIILVELERNRSFWSGLLPLRLRTKLVNRIKDCEVAVDGLCLKRFPGRLGRAEITAMQHYIESTRFAHLSVASLIILARRKGDVICNGKTWYRYMKRLGWQRPLSIVVKPARKRGIRATRIHQYWHVDASVIILPDGSKNYLQVIIDNYSRFVLAWHLTDTIDGATTSALIDRAKNSLRDHRRLGHQVCCLIADAGSENVNRSVQEEIRREPAIIMRLAKREIWGSNAMVEAFFKTFKHQFLSFRSPKNPAELAVCIEDFISKHNTEIPYAHLQGRTPVEVLENKSIEIPTPITTKERAGLRREEACKHCK
jgi:transposase InsO family protein